MNSLRWLGAALAFAAFAGLVGYFSEYPALALRGPRQALVKLSISHQGQLRYECRQRSAEEMADMPANMRRVRDCPRERWPVAVTLDMDGKPLFEAVVEPAGLANDGTSYVYRRLKVPSGPHTLALAIRDSREQAARTRRHARKVDLRPGEVVVVEYVNGQFKLIHGG